MIASGTIDDFLREQRLPQTYAETAQRWFIPLAEAIAHQRRYADRPLLIGINGSQGSGKSTLAALLKQLLQAQGLAAIDLSIDDFYRTRAERQHLAEQIHPLLATRGVPGTHDLELMRTTLDALCHGSGPVAIPRFDKAQDDRRPQQHWPRVDAPLDLVIIEGWCLGTPAQPSEALREPINALEREQDPQGLWRHHVNQAIEQHYQPLYAQVDLWVMLKAPSFDNVYRWRLQQEQKLQASRRDDSASDSRIMDERQIAQFIQYYQRLTEQALISLPERVHFLYQLDEQRQIVQASQPLSP